jgi:hypothetical protein
MADSKELEAAGFQRSFRKPVDGDALVHAIADLAEQRLVDRRLIERRSRPRPSESDRRSA